MSLHPAARQHPLELIVILGILTGFAPLSIDMYLPSLPRLEEFFNVPGAQVQWTLGAFFFGFAFGQFCYGPLTDRFGRKGPLYVGLALYAAASAACALAPSVLWLTGLRFVQALGACAGVVIARAMVRDLFAPEQMTRVFSTLMLITGLAPMLAPLLGGYLLKWYDWPAIFWFLAGIGLFCLVLVRLRLHEPPRAAPALPLTLERVLMLNGQVLRDRQFLVNSLLGATGFAGLFAYIAGAPFVFIQLFGVAPEHFGWIFGANALGLVLAAQVNGRVFHLKHPRKILRVASAVQLAAGVTLVAAALTGFGGMWGILVPLFVYLSSNGFVMPNATALAMAPHARSAGTASALLGTLQFGIAAVVTLISSALHAKSALPMAAIIAVCAGLTVLINRAQPPTRGGFEGM